MRERERSDFSPPALGGASLLVIFAVLALTIFALLSLSTVRADERLSAASAQGVAAHYAADCRAQELLARIRAGEWPEEAVLQEDGSYAYVCPISDTQELRVEVSVDGADYTILRWQSVPAGSWEVDNTIELWDMEPF